MFNEARLLDKVAYGSEFGQEFNTRIRALRSGVERRNANWSMPLGKYRVMYDRLNTPDHILVAQAHMASMGALIPFRFKDWTDFEASAESLGTATGVEQQVQLVKGYQFGSITLSRIIKKPVSGSVTIYANGSPIGATIDYTTGIATFTATDGDAITWSGQFDIPVRFESDRLDISAESRGQNGLILSSDVGLVEVRL